MAIQYISAAGDNSTSIALPLHQAGDLIVFCAFRADSPLVPTIPQGWYVSSSGTNNNCGMAVAWKIASTSSELSGTWSNATNVIASVYRSNYVLAVGTTSVAGGFAGIGGNIVYSGISPISQVTNKWHVAVAGHREGNTDIENPPIGMVNRTSTASFSDELVIFDTDGNSASWSTTSYTLTAGTGSGYRTTVAEIIETELLLASGGVRIPNIRGGADQ